MHNSGGGIYANVAMLLLIKEVRYRQRSHFESEPRDKIHNYADEGTAPL